MHAELQLDNQICFRLYTASRLITQAYTPMLTELGITYPQYLVLMVLWEKDCQPVNDIARRLVLETNTVTPLLQRMEKQGLVTRKIEDAQAQLRQPEDGVPGITLSVGVAFPDRPNSTGDIYRDADTAQYRIKNGGKDGLAFYD